MQQEDSGQALRWSSCRTGYQQVRGILGVVCCKTNRVLIRTGAPALRNVTVSLQAVSHFRPVAFTRSTDTQKLCTFYGWQRSRERKFYWKQGSDLTIECFPRQGSAERGRSATKTAKNSNNFSYNVHWLSISSLQINVREQNLTAAELRSALSTFSSLLNAFTRGRLLETV